jgi:hypothetical protein
LREPPFPDQQRQWLVEFSQDVSREFASQRDFIGLKYLHAQPSRMFKGMVVLADGIDWNPGAGAGMYRRNEANAAWVFVG